MKLCILSGLVNAYAVVLFYKMFNKWHTKLVNIYISTFWCGCFNCKACFKGEMHTSAKIKRAFDAYDATEID